MLIEKILECLENMEANELIHIHNEYCEIVNAHDDYIYSMDDLDMLCEGQDAFWIACRAVFGDFNASDDYIKFDGYGNFQTMNDYSARRYIDIDDIADYIVRENDSLYNDDIQGIIDEHEGVKGRTHEEEEESI